jgi:signal transduction histidine kinase
MNYTRPQLAVALDPIRNAFADAKNRDNNNKTVSILFEPEQDVLVEADKIRIYGVISNLLKNAIQFTKEGTITIAAAAEKLDYNEVLVSIKDTGAGIDPEIMPRLFTQFATKSVTGTGLGLFISKNIIEAHGGKGGPKIMPMEKDLHFTLAYR